MQAGLFRIGNFRIFRFLEDGDLHTDYKRTRQFRWKGLDDDLEVAGRKSDEEEEAAEDADEEAWRLQRLEREKWLKGKKKIFVTKKNILDILMRLNIVAILAWMDPNHKHIPQN